MAKKKVRANENIGLFLFLILGILFGAAIATGISGISTLGQGLIPIGAEGPIYPCQGTFLQHCDTPSSYTDHALDVVTVKQNERGLEFTDRSVIDTRCDVPGLCHTVYGINADFTNSRPCSTGQILQKIGINNWDCVFPAGGGNGTLDCVEAEANFNNNTNPKDIYCSADRVLTGGGVRCVGTGSSIKQSSSIGVVGWRGECTPDFDYGTVYAICCKL
jgi:hypothetical protein